MTRTRWQSLAVVASFVVPTVVYVAALLVYPNRDVLILWERTPPYPLALAATTVVLIAFSISAWRLLNRVAGDTLTRAQRWQLAGLVVGGGFALQLGITAMAEPDALVAIAERTYAWKANGYWTVGAGVTDIAAFIGQYDTMAPTYPVHQMRHPPGLSLVFTAGAALFGLLPGPAATVAGWLRPYSCNSLVPVMVPDAQMAAGLFGIVVEVALAMVPVLPVFALVRRLAGARAAVWAACLYTLMPGMGLWVTQFDRGFNLATALTLYFTERMVTESRLRHAAAAGLTLSFATFASFGAVPIGLMAGVYALVRLVQTGRWDLRRRAVQAGLVLAGAASVWLLCWVAFGLDPIALYHAVFDSHLGIEFPFWPFVAWHPWDAITCIGVAVCALSLSAGWRRAAALSAALWVPLATLSLLHVARAETGRVWMYFGAAAVAAAAVAVAGRGRRTGAALLVVASLQTLVMGAVLKPMTDIGISPQRHVSATVPATAVTVDTRFGASGQIALLAYDVSPLRPGSDAVVRLYWQRMSEQPLEASFKSFIHVAEGLEDQARVAQSDSIPAREKYPTTCWKQGEIVEDVHYLPVAAGARPGEYPVFVGLYDPKLGMRPPTFASDPARQMHGSVLLPTRARLSP